MMCARGEYLECQKRCFAAAEGGSWLRRTLTHHPSAGYCGLSFDSPAKCDVNTGFVAAQVLADIFGYLPLTERFQLLARKVRGREVHTTSRA